MRYCSTRDPALKAKASEVIVRGLSRDGGLFVPESFPAVRAADLAARGEQPYHAFFKEIAGGFLDDYSAKRVFALAQKAYADHFGPDGPAPVKKLESGLYAVELWHGPTFAFKDVALQLMPLLFSEAKRMNGIGTHSLILVATSGDTGKAALEGCKDLPGISVAVFYPRYGVSEIQRLQMTTQEGGNVFVAGVDGNFDDTQRSVKALMTDEAFKKRLGARNIALGSANSINWGRLAPQIVYYFTSYMQLVRMGEISVGEQVNFAVPSGNFGNILAGYYAKRMGLPINRLICASNRNDVLTEFIGTGEYNASRPFHTTISPSMDILVSSNIERLVFSLTGNDAERTRSLYKNFQETRRFCLNTRETAVMREQFAAYSCDDGATKERIREVFRDYKYLIDPHTAVGLEAVRAHRKTGDGTPTLALSTASPYKFADSVLSALGYSGYGGNGAPEKLAEVSGVPVPDALLELPGKAVRFDRCYDVSEQREALASFAGKIPS